MNSQMIGSCKNCEQDYCQECTNAEHWQDFCSKQCEKEFVTIGC